jgi:hypothetical protein
MIILKKISKTIFAMFFGLFITSSFASTNIQLTCKLDIEKNYRNSTNQNFKKDILIDISEINNQIFIIPKSELGSITTNPKSISDSANNLSNDKVWNITNTSKSDGVVFERTIQIDKNTGVIFYNSNFDEGKIITAAKGFCQNTNRNSRKITEDFKPAYKISCEKINYPYFADLFNREGTTTVTFIVEVDGNIRNPEIKVSSGSD